MSGLILVCFEVRGQGPPLSLSKGRSPHQILLTPDYRLLTPGFQPARIASASSRSTSLTMATPLMAPAS